MKEAGRWEIGIVEAIDLAGHRRSRASFGEKRPPGAMLVLEPLIGVDERVLIGSKRGDRITEGSVRQGEHLGIRLAVRSPTTGVPESP